LYVPSRNTGQGDCCHGELNLSKGRRRETKFAQFRYRNEAKDLKGSKSWQ
jgi:hypothetical protein